MGSAHWLCELTLKYRQLTQAFRSAAQYGHTSALDGLELMFNLFLQWKQCFNVSKNPANDKESLLYDRTLPEIMPCFSSPVIAFE